MNYQVLAVLMFVVPLAGLFIWLAICDEVFRWALVITVLILAWVSIPVFILVKGGA